MADYDGILTISGGRTKRANSGDTVNVTSNMNIKAVLQFEGSTDNDFETTLAVTDPTADRTITLPDAGGTAVLRSGSLTSGQFLVASSDTNSIESSSLLTVATSGSNKYLGINQSSPEVTLHMTGNGGQSTQIRLEQHNDTADAPDIRTRKSRGTASSPSNNSAGDYLFRINAESYENGSYVTKGSLQFDTSATDVTKGIMQIQTHDGTSNTTRFGVNQAGKFYIGASAYTFPTSDGSPNQVLQTNGSGVLSFATVSGGSGISNIVEDTTPQLGGDLDVKTRTITSNSSNVNITSTQSSAFVNIEASGSSNKIWLRTSGSSSKIGIGSYATSDTLSYPIAIKESTSSTVCEIRNTNDSNGNADGLRIRVDKSSALTSNSSYIEFNENGTSRLKFTGNGSNGVINNIVGAYKIQSSSTVDIQSGSSSNVTISPGSNFLCDAGGDITLDAGGRNIYLYDSGNSWIDFQGANSRIVYNGTITHDSDATIVLEADTNINLDAGGDITLDADGGQIYFKDGGTTYLTFNVDGSTDSIEAVGNLTLDASGDMTLDAGGGQIYFKDDTVNKLTFDMYNNNAGYGNFQIGDDSSNSVTVSSSDTNAPYNSSRTNNITYVHNANNSTSSDGIKIKLGGHSSNPTTSNAYLVFSPNNSTSAIGSVTGNGSGGVNYNQSFTGSHISITSDSSLSAGLIVESSGQIWTNNNAISTALPKTIVSNTNNSKKVYGVISSVDANQEKGFEGYIETWGVSEGETPILVNSLGEGRVWVTNINGNIENGDYVTTSEISGHGRLQDDDLLHNYTVAKCTETVNWSTIADIINHNGIDYKKYLIACTYHCG